MSHFDTPSSGIQFKGPFGIYSHVRRDESVPGSVALLVEEELDIHPGIPGLDGGAGVAIGAVPLGGICFLKTLDDIRCTEVAQCRLVFGLSHLDHPDDVALDVAAVDEPKQFRTREPAVHQQVVEAESLHNSPAEHLDGEEREQDKQFHQLNEGELAVRILNRTHRLGLYDELIHHVAYRIDCLAGVIMFEKIFEFRDYLSNFVHG